MSAKVIVTTEIMRLTKFSSLAMVNRHHRDRELSVRISAPTQLRTKSSRGKLAHQQADHKSAKDIILAPLQLKKWFKESQSELMRR